MELFGTQHSVAAAPMRVVGVKRSAEDQQFFFECAICMGDLDTCVLNCPNGEGVCDKLLTIIPNNACISAKKQRDVSLSADE